ncbi:MAG: hypothetical protein ABI614_25115, partial [Planctomycetota bacterium]
AVFDSPVPEPRAAANPPPQPPMNRSIDCLEVATGPRDSGSAHKTWQNTPPAKPCFSMNN